MKKLILLSLVILLIPLSLAAQDWEVMHSPLKNNLTGIQLISTDTILLVSNKGDFARSYSGGRIWGGNNIALGISLEDLCFISVGTGFVCGSHGTLLKTVDSGKTWTPALVTDSMTWFFDVEMIDDKNGLVVGLARTENSPFGGIAFRTTDGGDHWNQIDPGGLGYSELFVKNDTIFLLSIGKLNWSTNKGRSWESIITHEGKPARAISIFGSTYLICGMGGNVFHSHDNGKSWYPAKQSEQVTFVAAQLIDENYGYIAGGPGVLMKTTDGCYNWTDEKMPIEFTIFDFYLEADYLYAVGSNEGFIRKKVK